MRSKDVTIRNVADESGVSIATVSRVLNGQTLPGSETTLRVLNAVQKLGYTRQIMQDNGCRPTILAVLHDVNIGYLDLVVKGIYNAVAELNYNITTHVVRDNNYSAPFFLELAKSLSACGIIFISACVPTSILRTLEASIPLVKCVDVQDDDDISCIGINDRNSFRDLTSHLLSTGRSRIAMLRASLMGEVSRYREEAFYETMHRNNKIVRPEWISALLQHDYNSPDSDYNNVCYFIQKVIAYEDRPNAIMCMVDTDAALVVKALHKFGLRVPEDIAVTGFYNLSISRLITPELTTVDTYATDIGYLAMKMLDERIHDPAQPHIKVFTNTSVIIRDSTAIT